jgi:SNF2 family DNA or RNA helicase
LFFAFQRCAPPVLPQDRCHRIGQTRPVTVYKLFAEETVDEDIFDMGERKSKLSKAVLQDDRQHQQAAAAQTAGVKGTDLLTLQWR